jgi:hypothetical protein
MEHKFYSIPLISLSNYNIITLPQKAGDIPDSSPIFFNALDI